MTAAYIYIYVQEQWGRKKNIYAGRVGEEKYIHIFFFLPHCSCIF
jgi:predicted Co/Zn/Cd cation transporter (cation efflux family)